MRINLTFISRAALLLCAAGSSILLAQARADGQTPSPAQHAGEPAAPLVPGPGGAIPPPAPPGGGAIPGYRPQSVVNGVQITTPQYEDVFAVLDALPDAAAVKPKKPRKILVYSRAQGYAHSNIPLTAFTIKELGDRTGAWSTTITYSLEDFNAATFAQYDVLVLNNTTGTYLDDPEDPARTQRRKAALLDYVRSGHGLVLTHASGDSYHRGATGLWPEYNKMVGGFFKWHWYYPQQVTVKIDDPKSRLNAGFDGNPFIIHDEIYTFAQDSFSRKNVHVLTSVDYSKMSAEDKEKEPKETRRTDGDYALSWIRREGKGRVFYNVLGHSEHVLFMPKVLQHLLAGIQYAAGDLDADDRPSAK